MASHDEPIDVHHLFRSGELQNAQTGLGVSPSGRLTEAPMLASEVVTPRPPRTVSKSANKGTDVSVYRKALVSARYNVAEAARQLGLSRAQLAYRLKQHGLI